MAIKTGKTLHDHLTATRDACAGVKARAEQTSAALAAGTCSGYQIDQCRQDVRHALAVVSDASAAAGIVDYVRDQYADPNWAVADDFAAFVAAAETVIANIVAVGRDIDQMDAAGNVSARMFETGNTGTLKVSLDEMAATVE